VVLLVAVLMTVSVLALNGLVNPAVGSDADRQAPRGSAAPVPASNSEGGSVVTSRRQMRSLAVPDRTIALIFDDGPDPVWTPQVLSVLRRYDVPSPIAVSCRRSA